MGNAVVLSISQLNRYIKSVFDDDIRLQSVYVAGEISNFTNHYRTGHFYMTLKDENAAIKAVMFSSANARLRFTPENGMKVICRGRISVFERDGQYQLYIDAMQPDGAGALGVAFEQLKKKLEAEGLFSESLKKPIPQYPRRVGVITSPTGAAVRDIINILSRRFPLAEMVFVPVTVQGENASAEIAAAIEKMNSLNAADVLIVGRGGGSIEDLWAFNEERTARAVAASRIPVISAVGHETDYTICDFAADLRAPTPSAAAELAVPDLREEQEKIRLLMRRAQTLSSAKIADSRRQLALLSAVIQKNSPSARVAENRLRADGALMRTERAAISAIGRKRAELAELCAKLDALSPLKILGRGYAAVTKENAVVSSAGVLNKGDSVKLNFADGTVNCLVTGKD